MKIIFESKIAFEYIKKILGVLD